MNKDCIIIREYNIIKYFNNFINQEQILLLVEKYKQAYHTCLESHIYQGNVLG